MLRIGRRSRYSPRPKGSRRGLVVTLVVLALLVAILGALGYVGYRFYKSINQDPPLKVSYQSIDPDTTGQKYFGPINIEVKHVPQEITRGEETKISIAAGPESICSVLINGENSQSKRGLYTKKADDKGNIIWDWDVKDTVRVGSWPLEITCENPQHSGTLKRTIRVVDAED